jgi:2-dehydro-3-deoxyphosphogluconate aldolase/(4S)-4-hydroxy-2-oxoglutarate aldolase
LYDGGIRSIEITLNSPGAFEAIQLLSTEMEGRMAVGAGTVLNADAAKKAIDAGAQFIISPIFNASTIQQTKQHGVVSIPGAYTATEIYNAHVTGGDIIKVFPASAGPSYIKEILAPLPQIPLMPTGGVNLDNIQAFKQAGSVAFGLGKALVDTSQKCTDEYLQQLIKKAQDFVRAVNA